MSLVEIGHPQRGVVERTVRLGNIVMREIGELAEHGPDRTLTLAGELDELTARHLIGLAIGLAVKLGL